MTQHFYQPQVAGLKSVGVENDATQQAWVPLGDNGPTLLLSRGDWETIGLRMGWIEAHIAKPRAAVALHGEKTTLGEVIDYLDGAGLIVEDEELMTQALGNYGLSLADEIQPVAST